MMTEMQGRLSGEVKRAIEHLKPEKIVVTEPSEYRVLKDIEGWSDRFDIEVEIKAG